VEKGCGNSPSTREFQNKGHYPLIDMGPRDWRRGGEQRGGKGKRVVLRFKKGGSKNLPIKGGAWGEAPSPLEKENTRFEKKTSGEEVHYKTRANHKKHKAQMTFSNTKKTNLLVRPTPNKGAHWQRKVGGRGPHERMRKKGSLGGGGMNSMISKTSRNQGAKLFRSMKKGDPAKGGGVKKKKGRGTYKPRT